MTVSGLPPNPAAPPARFASRNRGGAGKSGGSRFQKALFCRCGAPLPSIAGLCASCYSRDRHSARAFGGNRERALDRDSRRCRVCGDARVLHVHHRHAGDHGALVTVCAACHARIHRTRALRRWMPEVLLTLWREWHRDAPEQLQLPLSAAATPPSGAGPAPA